MADPRRVQLALAAFAVAVVAVLGVRAMRASGGGEAAARPLPTLPVQRVSTAASADASEPAPSDAAGAASASAVAAAPASAVAGTPASGTATTQTLLVVHVAGAVRRPGVYDVRAGGRIVDAIRMAGGARRGADPDALNLAAPVTDGEQVLVPRRGEPIAGAAVSPAAAGSPGVPSATGAAAGGGVAAATPAPVDLNQATPEQLDALQGIGPALAQAILAYRQAHGSFTAVDDLAQVPGIGPARLETLRAGVRVG